MPHAIEQLRVAFLAGKQLAHLGRKRAVANLVVQALLCRAEDRGWAEGHLHCLRRCRQVNAQILGCLDDLDFGPLVDGCQISVTDVTQGASVCWQGQGGWMVGQLVGQMHDADQRVCGLDPIRFFMVVQNAVGQERVQVPALYQPSTGLGVGNVQGLLLQRTQVLVVG
ncbi:hypothetical protein GALL_485530 [mine drainage metagenome]|uniref:Uncharacterized protein n=1 Tax=mine drainage metagenome TaxID=410659 RepID=A0A1J5PF45_9ZZZZ